MAKGNERDDAVASVRISAFTSLWIAVASLVCGIVAAFVFFFTFEALAPKDKAMLPALLGGGFLIAIAVSIYTIRTLTATIKRNPVEEA